MSNSPRPTYGTHFSASGHMGSPTGSRQYGLPEYPYPYQNHFFLYDQGQTNGTPIATHTNSNNHSFNSNAQGSTTASSGNEVNRAPYAFSGRQIEYSGFQNAAYPPIPLAHSVPPYTARHFAQPSTNPNRPSNSSTFFPNLHPTTEIQSTNIGKPDTVPPALSELEDGELDDGEARQVIDQSRASTTTPLAFSQYKRHDNIHPADCESSRGAANSTSQSLPGLNQGKLLPLNAVDVSESGFLSLSAPESLATPNSQDFTSSQTHQYMPNTLIGNSDNFQSSRIAESTSVQHQISINNRKQEYQEVDQRLVDQKIEEAKRALRDLLSQGFDFDRIVSAGLNPDVLRELCNKIEGPVAASSNLLGSKIIKAGIVDVPTESAAPKTHDLHTDLPQKDLEGAVPGNNTIPHLVTDEVKINNQPTLTVANNEERSMGSQASSAKSSKSSNVKSSNVKSSNVKSSNVNTIGKASAIKAGVTKILDRKEYIARMLAAKAGKRAVSASIPVSSHTPAILDTAQYAQVRSSATAAPIVPATDSQAAHYPAETTLGSQKDDSDAEAKRKAQTDLARQKIEALKLRGSFQQQAPSANSSDVRSNSQQSPVEEVPNISAEGPAPSSRPLPSRQSSYFSPASQKPPFSIPGLFMTSDALEPASPSKQLTNENLAVSLQRVGEATFGSSQEGLRPHAAVSAQSPAVDKISSLTQISLGSNPALPASISTTSSNRKRQRASDFTDSPSTRVKRPLGQQEDTSVIIDISDDEVSNDTSGDDSLDTAGCRDSIPRKSQVTASGNGKKDITKNLPPPTDLLQRKKSVMITPPAAQVSAQGGGVNGLKSKEMEIQVMNRKIAELEQRIAIKAKQTTSRSHSPGTSSRLTISPPPGGASHQIKDPPHIPLGLSNLQNGDVAHVENRESLNALAETIETVAADQLNAEQQLEQVEQAKAKAERSLAAEAEDTLAAAADQSLTRENSIRTPQAEERSNSWEGEQRSEDEEQEQGQIEEERRPEESQSRQPRREEIKRSRQEEADRYLGKQEQTLAQQEQERKRTLNNQWQARKSEIESGLPLLDAEVERTRERLESLRQEMAGLETQLQKGIEGKKGLIAELHMLSRSRETLPRPMDLVSCNVSDVAKQTISTEESPAVTEPSALVEVVASFDPVQLSGIVRGGTKVREKDTSMQTTEDRTCSAKVEDDTMDISRSDVNEAELSLYSPKAVTEVRDTSGVVDDDENYEPPSEIGITQRQESDHNAVLLSQNLETAKAILPAQSQIQTSTDPNAEHSEPIERRTSGEPSPAASVDMADDDQLRRSLSRSSSLANASDSDDYEPPEPASLGDEVPRSTHMSSLGFETSFLPRDIETNNFAAHASSDPIPAIDQQMQKHESTVKVGLFTPYESPLKQFKSFRYHPRYLEEVSNGFRSLTYSHTINPDIPLCRYELDGVCNDDSCQSQHLRRVGMSDDKILVDLGAKPDNGSSPDDFGNGLREIIHDIRSRKIRDFNVVAGEITAYRAKFLGDSSKVLPLVFEDYPIEPKRLDIPAEGAGAMMKDGLRQEVSSFEMVWKRVALIR